MNTLEEWLALLSRRHPKNIDLGLERCGEVYRRLGSPRPARRVITVAGTNGKGSTVAYLEAMGCALGQRCGSYTSPHLLRFNERIRLQGQPVSDGQLLQSFDAVERARGTVSLTYFEFTTLAAFVLFEQAALDLAVLEVGLGGRLDAVNLVDADCTVITAIGLDHQEYLGRDIDAIAAEKAGIMRPGVPLVLGANPPAVVLQRAAALGAPCYRRGTDFDVTPAGPGGAALAFTLKDVEIPLTIRMQGRHQHDNLAVAMAAFLLLNPNAAAETLAAALDECVLPGRLQSVGQSPELLLDVGHNALAAEAVAAYLEGRDPDKTVCVIAMLADKPAGDVAEALERVVGQWHCVDTRGERGQAAALLAGRIRARLPQARVYSDGAFEAAVGDAMRTAGRDGTVLVFGSFSVVADASRWLQAKASRQP